MATLKNKVTGVEIVLLPQHTFGRRNGVVNTHLELPNVSQSHATVQWEHDRWVLIDHSRNGTWLDAQLIHRSASGGVTRVALKVGQSIRFSQFDESMTWVVESISKPEPQLLPLPTAQTSENNVPSPIILGPINALPNEANPEKILRRAENGDWVLEFGDDIRDIKDGDIIDVNGMHWQFHCSGMLEQTIELQSQKAVMEFFVSLDEEHISVRFNSGSEHADFGERVHHYVLLLLARKRLEDIQKGFAIDDCGWLSLNALAMISGIQPASLNMQIFRLRKQFLDDVPEGKLPPQVLERRRGEIRYVYPEFKIVRGSTVEAEWPVLEPLAG